MGSSIIIGGLIAAGKTSLIHSLEELCIERGLRCKTMLELYTDSVRSMVRKNLAIEDAFMFGHRIQMAKDTPDIAQLYDVVLLERSFVDHLAFISAFVDQGLLPSYLLDWSKRVVEETAPPIADHYVFLQVAPELAYQRRNQRAASKHSVFTLEFLRSLQRAYDQLLPSFYTNVLTLDWSEFNQHQCLDELLDQLVGTGTTAHI